MLQQVVLSELIRRVLLKIHFTARCNTYNKYVLCSDNKLQRNKFHVAPTLEVNLSSFLVFNVIIGDIIIFCIIKWLGVSFFYFEK